MKLITGSRLFGILLIAASLPLDPGVALAASYASGDLQKQEIAVASGSVEARLQRIATALRDAGGATELGQGSAAEQLSWWRNVGFRNGGGFRDGGFRNGGFGNGGFGNGGFRNGGFRNGAWLNL